MFNPYIVFYNTTLVPKRFHAYSYGPIIFIAPMHKNNYPLEVHEATHSHQFWRTFGLHGIFYMISKEYRFKAEVEAYGNQIIQRMKEGLDPDYQKYAKFLAVSYNVGKSISDCQSALYGYVQTNIGK